GRPADANRALDQYMGECKRGQAFGCVWGGLLFEERANDRQAVAKALGAYEGACNYETPGYCVSTAEIQRTQPGRYAQDRVDRRACDGGDQRGLACYNAAIVYAQGLGGVPRDLARATRLLDKACRQYDTKKACIK